MLYIKSRAHPPPCAASDLTLDQAGRAANRDGVDLESLAHTER